MRLTALISLVVAVCACQGVFADPDAGELRVNDAGQVGEDGGQLVRDGGLVSTDGGLPRIDAGTPADGGGSLDAGSRPPDAGAQADAGSPSDAGTPPFDAGAVDAGQPQPIDAGDPALAGHIFNAPASARANDVLSLQGDGFGSAPHVWLETAGSRVELPVVNRVGTTWLAAQLPSVLSTLGVWVRVDNGWALSARVPLNDARPYHLDAVTVSPGGAFRIFGRNLQLPGLQSVVKVDGKTATCRPALSEEQMLVCDAPMGLTVAAQVELTVDNGAGHGPTRLERAIAVSTTGSGDPFGLGVGWAAAFSTFSANLVTPTLAADGVTDDRPAIQAAMDSASAQGGGVVMLPASKTIRITTRLDLPHNVVLRGAGKDSTTLLYEGLWPLLTEGRDLIGVMDLTLTNNGSTENVAINRSTRVFLKNVRIENGASLQAFFAENRDMVVHDCEFIQTGKRNGHGPFHFGFTSGLSFVGNTVQFVIGTPDFHGVHDAYLADNHISRDSSNQNIVDQSDGVVHLMALDFAYRTTVFRNTFDTLNGPVSNLSRNDGETIISEGGGANRTENLGTVQSATANTLTDATNSFNLDPFGLGQSAENFGVWITGGTGAGQMRSATGYDPATRTLTVDQPWVVRPDSTSHYATFVVGLEKVLMVNNLLSDNSRGIWLYQTSAREIDIVGNHFSNNAGIYLRAWQDTAAKQFCPQYDVNIENNVISNLAGANASHATALLVQKDNTDLGMAFVNLRLSGNSVTASRPNFTSAESDYSSVVECYRVASVYEGVTAMSTAVPRVLGTVLQRNRANNCDAAFHTGTGAGGIVLNSTTLGGAPTLWVDEPTPGASGGATDVVVIP